MSRLHELLQLQRSAIFFDTETTGPNPTNDRVVELGFTILKPNGEQRHWASFINPEVPIPKAATFGEGDYTGHGITDEMVQGCRVCGRPREDTDQHPTHEFTPWPTFKELAPHLLRGFHDVDYGGYNIKTFDMLIMQEEFKRAGVVWSLDGTRLVDGYRIWMMGQKRSLSDASEFFLGEKHEGAHRVGDDVQRTMRVIEAQLERYAQMPREIGALHAACFPVVANALDSEGKFVWKDGIAIVNFGKKWKGMPLTRMTRRDLDWIANKAEAMPEDVKQICRDCLKGKFPVPPVADVSATEEPTE